MRSDRTGRRRFGAAWVGVALAMLLAVQAWTSAVDAQARSGVAPPPGDCWNGALSNDPLHCYMFEEAQRDGLIEVAGVYFSPGYSSLFIILKQSAPLSADVGASLRDKAHEYMTDPARSADYGVERCDGTTGDKRKSCLDYLLGNPSWRPEHPYDYGLPESSVYFAMVFDGSGAKGMRSRPGWASWRQVWPAVAGGSASGSAGFDVSDVNVTTVPEADCDSFNTTMYPSCYRWLHAPPELGIAGQHNDEYGGILYVHLTTPIPNDETELEALKQRIIPGYDQPSRRRTKAWKSEGWQLELVPAKYDFGQLWRWSVILERFARSAANTVGIIYGVVTGNLSREDEQLVYLNGVRQVAPDTDWHTDYSTVRTILGVLTSDLSATVQALPRLLPALGIPADAVGQVKTRSHFPNGALPLSGGQPASPPAQGGETAERAPPPELDCDDDSGAPLLSFCDAW